MSIAVGFLQIACKMFKATSTSQLSGHTFCSEGHRLTSILRCNEDGQEYAHWSKAPLRGVQVGDQTYTYTTDELKARAAELPKYDSIQVEKVVPFKDVGVLHTFGRATTSCPRRTRTP